MDTRVEQLELAWQTGKDVGAGVVYMGQRRGSWYPSDRSSRDAPYQKLRNMRKSHDLSLRPALVGLALVLFILAGGGCEPGSGETVANASQSSQSGRDAEGWLGEAEFSIGVLEGDDDQVLGKIAAVAVPESGSIIVADSWAGDLRLFDAGGRHVKTVGRAGAGPGEYTAIGAVLSEGDRVIAIDRTGKFTEYDNDLNMNREVRLPFLPMKPGCLLDDRLVLGESIGESRRPFHIVELNGTVIGSLGVWQESESGAMRNQKGEGDFDCADGVLVHATSADGVIRGWDLVSGKLRWEEEIPDYMELVYRQLDGGAVEVGLPDGVSAYDRVEGLTSTGDGLLLQVGRRRAEDPTVVVGMRSWLVDSETGTLTPLPSDIPRVTAASHSRIVTLQEIPFPQITVYERR
ncbi:MAG: 6-bladed beta-propeller [Gemmatimonadota bacterium]|nr:6-bladed beta-propeller [Gemmatimonadota bacterium]